MESFVVNKLVLEGLDPNDTKPIIDALLNTEAKKKDLKLERELNPTISQKFIIPKWATKKLIEQIYICIGYTSINK